MIPNPYSVILFLFIVAPTFAQTEINNVVTDKHKQVKGTKFLLIPPDGFADAVNFQGFQQMNSNASILVIEIPGPFSETSKAFNDQSFKTQGIVLKDKDSVKVNGHDGLFISSEQFAHGIMFSKYTLTFGTDESTFMVNGMFPKEIASLKEDVLTSMRSVVYDSSLFVDPLADMTFSVKTDETKLKFGKNISGSLLYSVDGKVPTESMDKTSFIVGLSLANVQTIDKKLSTINRLKRMPYTDLKINEDQINEIQIDGISGYEIIAEGSNKKGVRELIYHVMLYTDNGYYIIIGTTQNDFEDNLRLFKQVAKTLKRK